MINDNVTLELFNYDLQVCTELQVLSKTASHLWFNAYKKYKNVTMQDVQLNNVTSSCPYASAEVTILVREYPENYKK